MSKLGFAPLLIVSSLAVTGCATQDYVDKHVATVQGQVSALQGQATDTSAKVQLLDQNTQEALKRAEDAGKLAEGKFDYSMVMSDDSAHFPASSAALSTDETAKLDELATKLKSDNRNVYLEIQGYTDSTGAPAANVALGQQRAEAVRLFLNEQGVALNRMATISYGQDNPIASNDTRDGRAQNRRVVMVVLE